MHHIQAIYSFQWFIVVMNYENDRKKVITSSDQSRWRDKNSIISHDTFHDTNNNSFVNSTRGPPAKRILLLRTALTDLFKS